VSELNQRRLSERDLPEGRNFRDCSTAEGPLLLFSTRLIHCPKLVRLRDEQSDPEEVERGINFFIPDIEKFPASRESQEKREREREDGLSSDARSLDLFLRIADDEERPEVTVLQIG